MTLTPSARCPGVDARRKEIHPLESSLSPLAMSDREDELADVRRSTGRISELSGAMQSSTRGDGADVVIEVGDTGTGMTTEVAGRAFDAVFTTKEFGQGAGLGLDVARRIVMERNDGQVEIDARPGRTALRVRLPVAPPRA